MRLRSATHSRALPERPEREHGLQSCLSAGPTHTILAMTAHSPAQHPDDAFGTASLMLTQLVKAVPLRRFNWLAACHL